MISVVGKNFLRGYIRLSIFGRCCKPAKNGLVNRMDYFRCDHDELIIIMSKNAITPNIAVNRPMLLDINHPELAIHTINDIMPPKKVKAAMDRTIMDLFGSTATGYPSVVLIMISVIPKRVTTKHNAAKAEVTTMILEYFDLISEAISVLRMVAENPPKKALMKINCFASAFK